MEGLTILARPNRSLLALVAFLLCFGLGVISLGIFQRILEPTVGVGSGNKGIVGALAERASGCGQLGQGTSPLPFSALPGLSGETSFPPPRLSISLDHPTSIIAQRAKTSGDEQRD